MSDQVIEIFDSLPRFIMRQPSLLRRAAAAQAVLLLEAGQASVRMRLSGGKLDIQPMDGPMQGWHVALRAAPAAWLDHWQSVPAPDAFDIFGMARRGRMRIEGDFTPLMRHLQVIKDILALPRAHQS